MVTNADQCAVEKPKVEQPDKSSTSKKKKKKKW